MPWIRTIGEAAATGELQELYEKLTEPWGGVDNIMKIHSLNPVNRLAQGLDVELEKIHGGPGRA